VILTEKTLPYKRSCDYLDFTTNATDPQIIIIEPKQPLEIIDDEAQDYQRRLNQDSLVQAENKEVLEYVNFSGISCYQRICMIVTNYMLKKFDEELREDVFTSFFDAASFAF
jgi:hypothetical protein